MPRIEALALANAPAASAPFLEGAQKKLGMLPNLFRTLAHSPVALQAYAGQTEALGRGALSPALREQIAVATAGRNGCDYCASAHTLLGKRAGVGETEIAKNLRSESADPKVQAVLDFVSVVIEQRGRVTNHQLAAIRGAGFSEAEIVEMVAHVGMNIFTNYFNNVAETEVDFPRVHSAAVAA